ncbi:MAG TPA: energy-coupling factor ABC transporter ATP-binding protein, partial [Erysipelotrichaceae bacterium]|nr:energy-coupling factor ABC transporter ATP-binding protein [Erysipelotrichaceae bacterium]
MNVIEVNNLSFSYGDNINAIDNVSFKIKEGSYTTIIGHNGSGKSTIAKLLIGLLEPLKGNIMVEGVPLTLENLSIIRGKIGIVFQNPDNQFIGSTVRDDIAFGLENYMVPQKDMDAIIERFSDKVNMRAFLNSEPSRLSG